MEVVDAQVHILKATFPPLPKATTTEQMLDAMQDVRVDAALLVNVSALGADSSYMLEGAARHPDLFAVIAGADPTWSDLNERMGELRSQPHVVGVRAVIYNPRQIELWKAGAFTAMFAAAQRHQIPVCVYPPGLLHEMIPIVAAFPNLQFIIDHLGLHPEPEPNRDHDPFGQLPDLLNLAGFPNVAVKASGVPALSRHAFPFPDVWPHLHRVISVFGLERVMWGTDWTRVTNATYAEGVDYVRESSELSASDKEQIMGKTLRTILRWPRRRPNA